MMIMAIGTYFLPFISRNLDNPKKIRKYLYNKRPKIILLFALGVIFLFFVLPYFFDFVYGETYSGAARITQILLLASLFSIYWNFYGPIIGSMEKYKFMQISNVFFVMLNLGLDVVFVRYYGFVGAAIATTISYGVMGVIYEIYFRKYCKPLLFK